MTITDLQRLLQQAVDRGIPPSSTVKLYINNCILPCVGYQFRFVQTYDTEGASSRNKFVLLSAEDISKLSST